MTRYSSELIHMYSKTSAMKTLYIIMRSSKFFIRMKFEGSNVEKLLSEVSAIKGQGIIRRTACKSIIHKKNLQKTDKMQAKNTVTVHNK